MAKAPDLIIKMEADPEKMAALEESIKDFRKKTQELEESISSVRHAMYELEFRATASSKDD